MCSIIILGFVYVHVGSHQLCLGSIVAAGQLHGPLKYLLTAVVDIAPLTLHNCLHYHNLPADVHGHQG